MISQNCKVATSFLDDQIEIVGLKPNLKTGETVEPLYKRRN